ncbi:MAG TPA: hypothetical protein VM425_06670 [Myxococcota bacterium]|nr:hypothetical protein [Myxococcota bacterium]
MQRLFALFVITFFVCVPNRAGSQDLGGFEVPDDFKRDLGAKKCPPGTTMDDKGECRKEETAPVSAPADKPAEAPTSAEATAGRPVGEPAPTTVSRPPLRAPSAEEKKEEKKEEKNNETEKVKEETKEAEKEETKEKTKEEAAGPKGGHFIKGELADFIGSNKLVTKNNRIGVRLGYRKVNLAHYATIDPEADFRIWKFQFGLGVPLALEIFDGAWDDSKNEPVGFDDAGDFRKEDWNEPSEYVRFIRYLRFGRKEDHFFFNLSQYSSTTIGHGPLMRRYNVNVDPNSTRLAVEMDMYNDYAGFEFVGNDVVNWDLFGAIAFVKPLSLFMDNPTARSLSLGVTYIADRHAPVTLKTLTDPSPNSYYLTGTDRPEINSSAFLHALGVDMEIKVLKTASVDLKPYVDYSWFMPASPDGANPPDPEGGGGFTAGILGRFNFGSDPVNAIRAILEFRSFSSNYLPGYFDTFYEVQKFVDSSRYKKYAGEQGRLPPTKFEDVFIDRKGGDRHLGFYAEFTYSLVDYLALTLALEGSDADGGNNFLAHLEVPALSWLQFFTSYHHRAMDSLGNLFSSEGGNRIIFAAARMRVLPFLFINFRYHYTFQLREDFADLTGDGLEQRYRFYEAMHGWLADLELGWEF